MAKRFCRQLFSYVASVFNHSFKSSCIHSFTTEALIHNMLSVHTHLCERLNRTTRYAQAARIPPTGGCLCLLCALVKHGTFLFVYYYFFLCCGGKSAFDTAQILHVVGEMWNHSLDDTYIPTYNKHTLRGGDEAMMHRILLLLDGRLENIYAIAPAGKMWTFMKNIFNSMILLRSKLFYEMQIKYDYFLLIILSSKL